MRGAKFEKNVEGDVEPKGTTYEVLHKNLDIANRALEDVACALMGGEVNDGTDWTQTYNDACGKDPLDVQRRIDAL